jgi:hypothetical protein
MLSAPYATPVNLLRARAHRAALYIAIDQLYDLLPTGGNAWSHQIDEVVISPWEVLQKFFRFQTVSIATACTGIGFLLAVSWGLWEEDWAWAMYDPLENLPIVVSLNQLTDIKRETMELRRLMKLEHQPVDPYTGVYLTVASMEREQFRQATLDILQQAGGNALIFEAKGRKAFFRTGSAIAEEYDLTDPYSDLPRVIEEAHARGMTVIARYVAVRDFHFAERVPSVRIPIEGTKATLNIDWVDPADPTVLEFHRELLRDLLQYDIDEVNFDYIRYPTEFTPAATRQGTEERAENIETFLRMARDIIDEVRPDTRLGISTFAILGWRKYEENVAVLGQDVVRFAPLVDVISPMAYPISFDIKSYYNPDKYDYSPEYWLVYRTLKGYEERLGPDHAKKLRPWIQGYGLTTKQIAEEIKGVYGAGYCGFMVWNAQNTYWQSFEAMKMAGERPEHCEGDVGGQE